MSYGNASQKNQSFHMNTLNQGYNIMVQNQLLEVKTFTQQKQGQQPHRLKKNLNGNEAEKLNVYRRKELTEFFEITILIFGPHISKTN